MILALDEHREYAVHFFHDHAVGSGRLLATICTLHRAPCPEKKRPCGTPGAVEGIAACSPRDQPKKAIGRQIALARAMREAGLTRAERTALWRQYFGRIGRYAFRISRRHAGPDA